MEVDYEPDSHDDFNPQESSLLAKLPVELLFLIIDNLDAPSILALRLTCCLALDWVDPSFCKLLKSRKYFLHPYSFKLLEELSKSRFAECLERIVIGTETFLTTFHLTWAEYGKTLTATFPRFTHLRAVEIRDFVPLHTEGYYDYDINIGDRGRMDFQYRSNMVCRHSCEEDYKSRWGEEEDNLHSQGFRHVSAGYWQRAFRKPPLIVADDLAYDFPTDILSPAAQLGQLFHVTLHACTVAKTAGVHVTDFRVALLYEWGIRDIDMRVFNVGSGSEQEKFLSSLEVLHLPLFNEDDPDDDDSDDDDSDEEHIGTTMSIRPVLYVCTRLKWLRVDLRSLSTDLESEDLVDSFREMGHRLRLKRLDLGNITIGGSVLTSIVLKSRPKILNISGGTIREPQMDNGQDEGDSPPWGLAEVAGVVELVRLVHLRQYRGSQVQEVSLVEGGVAPITVPGVGNGYISLQR